MTAPIDRADFYRRIIENVPASLLVYDEDLTVKLVAGKAVERESHDLSEIEGRSIVDLLPPAQAKHLVPLYKSALEGHRKSVRYLSSADGRQYELIVRPVEEPDGSIESAVAVSLEVEGFAGTERKDWSLFRHVFEDATIGFAVLSADGTLMEVNPGWASIFGIAPDELRGRELTDLAIIGDRDKVAKAIDELLQGADPPIGVEVTVQRSDGVEIHCELRLSRAQSDDSSDADLTAQLQDISSRRAQEDRLRHMAEHDPLTDLLNRRAFEHKLAERLRGGRRADQHSAMLLIDLDKLKQINDQFGHLAGDDALKDVAFVLRGTLRGGDAIARIGGDEFAVLAATHDSGALESLAERIKTEVGERSVSRGLPMSVSIGIAEIRDGISDRELWRRADRAMYTVKGRGDGVAFWTRELDRIPQGSGGEDGAGGSDEEVGPGDEQRDPERG